MNPATGIEAGSHDVRELSPKAVVIAAEMFFSQHSQCHELEQHRNCLAELAFDVVISCPPKTCALASRRAYIAADHAV